MIEGLAVTVKGIVFISKIALAGIVSYEIVRLSTNLALMFDDMLLKRNC